jgi:subtilisin family serine protease
MRMLLATLLLMNSQFITPKPEIEPFKDITQPTPVLDLVGVYQDGTSLSFVRLDGSGTSVKGNLISISKNPKIRINETPFASSDDPLSQDQWGLRAIGAKAGWEVTTGSNIVVAVLDTGVEPHEDLLNVLPQKDFVEDGLKGDPNGHGTHVAGIIAAASNNKKGIAGTAPGVVIQPVRVLDKTGSGDHSDIASGIVWATDAGVDIINLSLGGEESSEALYAAVKYAYDKGVFVVAAAGNSGFSGNPVIYPASYDEVYSVAASSPDGKSAMFSSFGNYVDISAPGFAILSTTISGYGYMSGTSQAAPFVSAAAAMLIASGRGVKDIPNILCQSARDIEPTGRDPKTGCGFLDLAKSLGAGPTPNLDAPSLPPLPSTPDLLLPTLPTLRPPSLPNTPSFGSAPAVTISAPKSIPYGSRFDSWTVVSGCKGCKLAILVPGSTKKEFTVPAELTPILNKHRALKSGEIVVLKEDGTELASASITVEPEITISRAYRYQGRGIIKGTVQPASGRVVLQKLSNGKWRDVASSAVFSNGSFSISTAKILPGLYKINVKGTTSFSKTFLL